MKNIDKDCNLQNKGENRECKLVKNKSKRDKTLKKKNSQINI